MEVAPPVARADNPQKGGHIVRHILLDGKEALQNLVHLGGMVLPKRPPFKISVRVPVAALLRSRDVPAVEAEHAPLDEAILFLPAEEADRNTRPVVFDLLNDFWFDVIQ